MATSTINCTSAVASTTTGAQSWWGWSTWSSGSMQAYGSIPCGKGNKGHWCACLGFSVPTGIINRQSLSVKLKKNYQTSARRWYYAVSTTAPTSASPFKSVAAGNGTMAQGNITWTSGLSTETFALSAEAVAALTPGVTNYIYLWGYYSETYTYSELSGGSPSYPLSDHSITVEYQPNSSIISSASFTAGENLTVNIKRESSSYLHTVAVSVGGTLVQTQTGIATSAVFSSEDFKAGCFSALAGSATKTVEISLTTYLDETQIGSVATATGTCTAPAATIINSMPTTANIGSAIDISLARAQIGLSHTLEYSMGGESGYILGSGSSTSAELLTEWELPEELAYEITNATQGTVTLTVSTFYGNIAVRTPKTYSLNAVVVGGEPVFTTFTHEDTNAITLALTGDSSKYVAGYSTLQATISEANKAVGQWGASIVRYKLSVGESEVSEDEAEGDITIDMPSINGIEVIITAIDSRGKSTSVSYDLDIVAYTPIVLNSASVARTNGIDETTLLNLTATRFSGSFGAVTNGVEDITYRFKATGASTWTNGTTPITYSAVGGDISVTSFSIVGDTVNGFEMAESYAVEITIVDKLSSDSITLSLDSGYPALFIKKLTTGDNAGKYIVGINKKPTGNLPGLEVDGVSPGGDYTADLGIQIANDVITHTNAIAAKTTQGLYPVTIDAQGHIDGVGAAAGDYIVETGDYLGWHYRVYKSGWAECTRRIEYPMPTSWSSWGSVFASNVTVGAVDYPFGFTGIPCEICTLTRQSTADMWLATRESGNAWNRSAGYQLIRGTATSNTTGTYELNFHVSGYRAY